MFQNLIIPTKLLIPDLTERHVPRPILAKRIGTKPVSAIIAPAGYGKTTLVAEWARQKMSATVWLSLDEEDRKLNQFVRYVVEGMYHFTPDNVHEQIQQLERHLNTTKSLTPSEWATLLINTWAVLPPFVLILDDYHRIGSESTVHNLITIVIDNLPSAVRLVIASREEPPLPFSRLRMRQQLVEITESHLRFNIDHLKQYLQQTTVLKADSDQLHALNQHLEGWIAGIQLVMLLLNDHDIDQIINKIHGNMRELSDYFFNEVLAQQPANVQAFLIETSILDDLSPDLCNAVLKLDDSQQLLDSAYRQRLFITCIDGQTQWYRYHQLFREFLQKQALRDKARYHHLHERAAHWYAAIGRIDDAIRHAIQGQQWSHLRQLVSDHAPKRIASGDTETVLTWLEAIPEIYQDDVSLMFLKVRVLFIRRAMQKIDDLLLKLQNQALSADQQAELAVWRGCTAYLRGDYDSTIAHLEANLAQISAEDNLLQIIALDSLGTAYAFKGRLANAEKIFNHAIEHVKHSHDTFLSVVTFQDIHWVYRIQGQLRQAYDTIEQAMLWAERAGVRQSPWVRMLYAVQGTVYMDWMQLDKAEEHLNTGLQAAREIGSPSMLSFILTMLAGLYRLRGDYESAFDYLNEVDAVAHGHEIPDFASASALVRVQFWIETGNHSKVSHWLKTCELDPQTATPEDAEQMLVYARALLLMDRPNDALDLLQRIDSDTELFFADYLDIMLVRALAIAQTKRIPSALTILREAVELAQPENVMWLFVEKGQPMIDLLTALKRNRLSSTISDFIARVLRHLEKLAPRQKITNPLTEREQEVLYLLAQGQTTTQIAAELVLSSGTVRNHVKSIYRKLGVNNRVQMLERGRKLRLI